MASAPRIPILKIIIWCLVIGLLLSMFNATPEGVYAWAGETGKAIFEWLWEFGQTSVPMSLWGPCWCCPFGAYSISGDGLRAANNKLLLQT